MERTRAVVWRFETIPSLASYSDVAKFVKHAGFRSGTNAFAAGILPPFFEFIVR